ncbi:DUF6332 family protein [Streptomyces abyssalis]|uniref:DUF6332 family protein n=1 Tax=Streptomyces abyssalis TaxID=933944 RepID=UPI00085BB70D|nr:DUF6332 family protein [Streptomyces abyssalis]
MRGPRTQAERDAQTVEIGFALLTGALMAGLALLVFLGLLGLLTAGLGMRSASDGNTLLKLAGGACVTVFVARVVYVLLRAPAGRRGAGTAGGDGAGHPDHEDADHLDGSAGAGFAEGAGGAGPQPSQPGRTSPDS